MPTDDEQELRDRLRHGYRPGTRLSADCAVVEVRDVPIPLDDTGRDFHYTDYPVASAEEWLDSVGLGLEIYMDTGFRTGARRTAVDDYIELRADGGWPVDERFYYDVVEPTDPYSWERVPFVAAAGLDPRAAVTSRDAGRLISWVTGYENNSTGEPYVAHAVVSWMGETTAHLEHVEVADGVPVTVWVDLAHVAAHAAGAAGALSVTTDLDEPELAVAGFRVGAGGQRVVDTSFLDEDPAGAARLLEKALRTGERWGQDRDAAGRYLPPGRVGRWLHRLRHGTTGAPPRRYVG